MSRWQRLIGGFLAAAAIIALPSTVFAGHEERKLDRTLNERSGKSGWSRVIITMHPASDATGEIRKLGGRFGRRLNLINGQVVEIPNKVLRKLAEHPGIARIDHDRPTTATLSRVSTIVGATAVRQAYGFTGEGVGVAVIDSGITGWHNDLTYNGSSSLVRTVGNQRVTAFADFVSGQSSAYDDNGHGTHVAGIIGGNGYSSGGRHVGIAPGAHLVSLKVLDREGRGVISNVIAAFEYAVANRAQHNIRVINLSVGAAVTSSYRVDPLTLAAKRATDAGIVVVTAAGNQGRNRNGELQWGGILSPGNAPWVLTVGASNHHGTMVRTDDTVADYSSSGPSAIDFEAKPDIVAPGTGTVSLADPTSLLYFAKSLYLVSGTSLLGYKPYLSLTGTSMAAPAVSGTVALMLQANPTLTPNLVKAVLQYTAQEQPGISALRQGGGFLNTKGAVDLARYFATATAGQPYPRGKEWSKTILWGSHRVTRGALNPSANAWAPNIVWGTAFRGDGDNIVWGTVCETVDCYDVVWGTLRREGDNIVWGTLRRDGDNIVWGTARGAGDNIVWGTARGEEGDNIVWGTDCGGQDCTGVIWGTIRSEGDNIVWGTAREGDNIVWGTSDNSGSGSSSSGSGSSGSGDATSGTAFRGDGDNIVWGTSGDDGPIFEDGVIDILDWEALFGPPPAERGGEAASPTEAL